MTLLRLLSQAEALCKQGRLRVVLGSQSPRRSRLLEEIVFCGRLPFVVKPSNFAEDHDKAAYAGKPELYVRTYAAEKSKDVEQQVLNDNELNAPGLVLIICCDTVVVQDGIILEKPNTPEEAVAMLQSYSGRSHEALSGFHVTLLSLNHNDASQVIINKRFDLFGEVSTKISFGPLDQFSIEAYVATGEPMDKAGAYGIQGPASLMIHSIEGCFFNAVGLPVYHVSQAIASVLESGMATLDLVQL